MAPLEGVSAIGMRPVSADEARTLIYDEADLLDQRRFEEWRDLFTSDGYYWVPARPEQTDPLDEVSIFYDDRQLMQTRIERLRHPRIHAENPPTRALRLVGQVRLAAAPAGADALALSRLVIVMYRQGFQRVFAAHCQHALRREGDALRIFWKRVDLLNADDVLSPLGVPF